MQELLETDGTILGYLPETDGTILGYSYLFSMFWRVLT